jgi:hypothetical protein
MPYDLLVIGSPFSLPLKGGGSPRSGGVGVALRKEDDPHPARRSRGSPPSPLQGEG